MMEPIVLNLLPVSALPLHAGMHLSASIQLTRELTEICITSRVQKVWVVEFVNGPTEIPQWPFLSVPVRAFERGVCPKLYPKTV